MNMPSLIGRGTPPLWVLCLFCCAVVSGCSKGYIGPVEDTPEGQVELGRRLVETGRYYDATVELEEFTSENPGSAMLDKALYFLGRAYMGRRDYAMASAEFERLLREFPGSEYAPDARYLLGVAGYEQSLPAELDPTTTINAIDQLKLFVRLHPESPFVPDAESRIEKLRERLAKKQYLNGKLYLKLNQPAAARFYFEIVLDEYGDTAWAPMSALSIAESYETEDEMEKAADEYNRLIQMYPDSEEAGKARLRVEELGFEMTGRSPDPAGADADGISERGDR